MSFYGQIPEKIPDGAFAMMEAFRKDEDKNKVNLSLGIYCEENAKTWVLPAVKKAREILLADPNLDHDISPQSGHSAFVTIARQIAFGDKLYSRTVTSMQTIGGTGANHFAARLISNTLRPRAVWLSDPSWENHAKIWKQVDASIRQHYYPYCDWTKFTLDIEGMISKLQNQATKGDVVILQACAHNPTGLDPSREQWHRIAEVCEEKELFPIFDLAYQGLATGDPDKDAWVIRHFTACGSGRMEFAVAQSFSKNFGLYGERVGVLHVVSSNRETADEVDAELKKISRAEITSTPSFGAKIVVTVMHNPDLKEQWHRDIKTMTNRMKNMRQRLYDELMKRKTRGNWDHILTDIGMFSMTDFSLDKGPDPDGVSILRNTFHVYLFPNGRLSFSGLTEATIEHVAESIYKVAIVSESPFMFS
ncbi:aspartate aminotransferase-like protein [Xylaria digitata]|nr:aspartate aminotransferase-like protein [Xylaria digitata]